MGRFKDEKWLEQLKDSVQNYSEHLPDNFWEGLQKDLPQCVPAAPEQKFDWKMFALPVAAILLLVLFIVWPDSAQVGQDEVIAVVEERIQQVEDDAAVATEEQAADELDHKLNENIGEKTNGSAGRKEDGNVVDNIVEEKIEESNAGKREDVQQNDVKEKDVQEKDVQEKSVQGNDVQRKEYLKELEYLNENESSNNRRGKVNLAFAGGRGRIVVPEFGETYYFENDNDMVYANSVNGLVNLGCLQNYANKVEWLGSMQAVANEPQYTPLSYNHKMPLKLGISIAKEVRERLYAESGVSYQYLKSNTSNDIVQKLHFIGIPVKLSYHFAAGRSFSAYASAGFMLEKCIIGVLEDNRFNEDKKLELDKIYTSLLCQLGAQVELGGGASLYLEPGLYYYCGMSPDGELTRDYGYIIKNIYSENPFGFSLQGGIRFSF